MSRAFRMASTEEQEPPVLVHARWGREQEALYDTYRMLCDTHPGELVRVRYMVSHMTSKIDRFTREERLRDLRRRPWVARILSEEVRRPDRPTDPFEQARASLEQTGGVWRVYELMLQC